MLTHIARAILFRHHFGAVELQFFCLLLLLRRIFVFYTCLFVNIRHRSKELWFVIFRMILSHRTILFSIVISSSSSVYVYNMLAALISVSFDQGRLMNSFLFSSRRRVCCVVIWNVYVYVVHVSTTFCFDGLRSIFVSTVHSLVQRVCMHAFDRENRIKGQKVREWPWSDSTKTDSFG